MDGKGNPLMDGKVLGVVFFFGGMVAMIAVVERSVTSPTTPGCSVV